MFLDDLIRLAALHISICSFPICCPFGRILGDLPSYFTWAHQHGGSHWADPYPSRNAVGTWPAMRIVDQLHLVLDVITSASHHWSKFAGGQAGNPGPMRIHLLDYIGSTSSQAFRRVAWYKKGRVLTTKWSFLKNYWIESSLQKSAHFHLRPRTWWPWKCFQEALAFTLHFV